MGRRVVAFSFQPMQCLLLVVAALVALTAARKFHFCLPCVAVVVLAGFQALLFMLWLACSLCAALAHNMQSAPV